MDNTKIEALTRSIKEANKGLLALSAAIGVTGGAVSGYFAAVKRLEAKFQQIADAEITEAREYYNRQLKEFKTPGDALAALHPGAAVSSETLEGDLEEAVKALEIYQGIKDTPITQVKVEERLVEVTHNVFTDAELPPFDLEEELRKRDPEFPYLITKDEFLEAGPDFDQIQLTYYEGDGVLADDKDEVENNPEKLLGNCRWRFGEGSEDANVFYVRNIAVETDFEIVRSKGKFAVEVLGFSEEETELRHSDQRRRKPRWDDE